MLACFWRAGSVVAAFRKSRQHGHLRCSLQSRHSRRYRPSKCPYCAIFATGNYGHGAWSLHGCAYLLANISPGAVLRHLRVLCLVSLPLSARSFFWAVPGAQYCAWLAAMPMPLFGLAGLIVRGWRWCNLFSAMVFPWPQPAFESLFRVAYAGINARSCLSLPG